MLLRLVDHHKDNPKRIDKLIAIKGLPEEWLFTNAPEGKQLRKPWEPDIDANIPHDIRHLCEPTYIVQKFAPTHAGAASVIEKKQILGIRIDYNTEPGRALWDDIERYIERTIPRDERVPVPVLCARDERSAFDTYTPRRNSRGTLELVPSPVPSIDLSQYVEVRSEQKTQPVPATQEVKKETVQDHEFKCEECDYHHASQRGIRMHAMKRHPKREKAVA